MSAVGLVSNYIGMREASVDVADAILNNGAIAPNASYHFLGDPYAVDHGDEDEASRITDGGDPALLLAQLSTKRALCSELEAPSEASLSGMNKDENTLIARRISKVGSKEPMSSGCMQRSLFSAFAMAASAVVPTARSIDEYAVDQVRHKIGASCKRPISNPGFRVYEQTLRRPENYSDKDAQNWKVQTFTGILSRKLPVVVGLDPSAYLQHVMGNHATLLIGSRWKNNRCEVEIRDSYGSKCQDALPGVECNQGNYWVGVENALTKVDSASWIE